LPELQARFGPASIVSSSLPIPDSEHYSFSKDGIYIRATLIAGRCEQITYSAGGLSSRKLTEQEIKDLLAANAGGKVWTPDDPLSVTDSSQLAYRKSPTAWKRTDRQLFAALSRVGDAISFSSAAYRNAMAETDGAAARQKASTGKRPLKGF
jgi:hypothetical protein